VADYNLSGISLLAQATGTALFRGKFFTVNGKVLEQLPKEAVDAPSIRGGVEGQVRWGPGQPGLV